MSKQVGQRLTLQWDFPPAETPSIQEFRIYRADRLERRFERIASVPAHLLEYTLEALEPGDFVFTIRAFNGIEESDPSNEVLLQVRP